MPSEPCAYQSVEKNRPQGQAGAVDAWFLLVQRLFGSHLDELVRVDDGNVIRHGLTFPFLTLHEKHSRHGSARACGLLREVRADVIPSDPADELEDHPDSHEAKADIH